VRFDDSEFIAAAHRLIRAAQESADEGKRDRLAAALAHSGSWSELPPDDRERMERLVIELTTREVLLLRIIADPSGWLMNTDPDAIAAYAAGFFGSFSDFLDSHVSKGDLKERAAVRSSVEALQMRGLIGLAFSDQVDGESILRSRASGLGWELVHFLNDIGA